MIQNLNLVVHVDEEATTGAIDFLDLDGDGVPDSGLDPADYTTDPVTGRVVRIGGSGYLLTTTRLTPIITWADPAEIFAGTALSGTQLNAAATDPLTAAAVAGSFTYSPASGAVLAAGNNQVLTVLFVPTDSATYYTASDTAEIDVLPLGSYTFYASPITADWNVAAFPPTVSVGGGVAALPDALAAAAWTVNDAASVIGGAIVTPSALSAASWSINAPTVSVGIARVQTAKNTGTSTTLSVTWGASTTANNLLVAVVHLTRSNGANVTCTAPASWSTVTSAREGSTGSGRTYIFYYENAPGQSSTGNFTASNAGAISIVVAEYSGIKTSSSLDSAGDGTGTGSSSAVEVIGAGSTTQAADLLVAAHGGETSVTFSSPTNSFSIYDQQAATDASVALLDRIVAATSTYTSGATSSASIKFASVLACFKGA